MCIYIVGFCRIFDSVVGNLAKNFAEGTEYFKVGPQQVHVQMDIIHVCM